MLLSSSVADTDRPCRLEVVIGVCCRCIGGGGCWYLPLWVVLTGEVGTLPLGVFPGEPAKKWRGRVVRLGFVLPIPGEPTKKWLGRVAVLGSGPPGPSGLAKFWRGRVVWAGLISPSPEAVAEFRLLCIALATGPLGFLGFRSGREAREPVSSSPARDFLLICWYLFSRSVFLASCSLCFFIALWEGR